LGEKLGNSDVLPAPVVVSIKAGKRGPETRLEVVVFDHERFSAYLGETVSAATFDEATAKNAFEPVTVTLLFYDIGKPTLEAIAPYRAP